MADHLIGKLWGISGALVTALLTLALIVPAGAQASGPGSAALSQLASVVPAPAQSAVAAALSQIPSASGAGASPGSPPDSPPAAPVGAPAAVHVPVVTPPAPPPTPVAAAPTPQPATPVSSATGVYGQAGGVRLPSVSQPDAAVPALSTGPSSSSPAGPDRPAGAQTSVHRPARPRAGRHADAAVSTRSASTGVVPAARVAAAVAWSPIQILETTSRRGAQPAAPARRPNLRIESGHARHVAPPRSRPGGTVTTSPPAALPLSSALPPGGADGSAAGAGGGAAGAATAALLALAGVCILRALLPGLLGLGLAPARSAFLVWRLERPG
jgi:hypothetical protein